MKGEGKISFSAPVVIWESVMTCIKVDERIILEGYKDEEGPGI
jgi:hypothetical protein